jgi:hypothetical protein
VVFAKYVYLGSRIVFDRRIPRGRFYFGNAHMPSNSAFRFKGGRGDRYRARATTPSGHTREQAPQIPAGN